MNRAALYLLGSDADRRALRALDIDEEPCGPVGRKCDEGQRCPHHGGSFEEMTAADTVEFNNWRRRVQ